MLTEAEGARQMLLVKLGLDPEGAFWRAGWEDSYIAHSDAATAFVTPDFVADQCGRLAMSAEVRHVLLDGLTLFDRSPDLTRLLWHCYHFLFERREHDREAVWTWPMLPDAPLFYAYAFLAGVPNILAQHAARDIPMPISVDTLRDFELWLRHYRQTEGVWGFGEYGWLQFHFRGKVYKLGRLQFEIAGYYYDYPAYRHRESGRIVVLAGDEMTFRGDGQCDGANGIFDRDAWTAKLQETEAAIVGHRIHPLGYAEAERIELSAHEWQPILKRRDPVLGVHIPATGPMDFDECGRSFARALPFFARHFPELQPKAFVCTSWLLDNQLVDYLDSASNIVRFLRQWKLLPKPGSDDHDFFLRLFNAKPDAKLESLSQTTSLQRAVVAHMQQGGRWRESGGLIFPDDHLTWGTAGDWAG